MFEFLKKSKEINLYAPVLGKKIPLDEVEDKVFASKMMGDGIAFEFEGDTVYAPCKGEIILIASTKHAFGIRAENGTEILIHIGLDTVNLNGQGFQTLVKVHDKVKVHDPIIRIDRELMRHMNINLTMPMIITNTDEYDINLRENCEVDLSSIVIQTKKKGKKDST